LLAVSVSVVVPAYNSSSDLRQCLPALVRSLPRALEIIVVDDASTDETSSVASQHGATVIRLARNSGPAAARNAGGRAACGDIVFFVDADVVVAPDAIGRVLRAFETDADLAAVFGSYDRRPRAPGPRRARAHPRAASWSLKAIPARTRRLRAACRPRSRKESSSSR